MFQVTNPYLPLWEYIPDAEPYVFGGRVYIYGSHDRFNAPIFCQNDYVCWSAPVDDLSSWRYEGVIYQKKQDPKNPLGLHLLFAPDVVQGTDGRFYLYYAFDFMGMMGVAVSDSPAGPFEFYGHVHHADGTIWGRRKGDSFPFDPAVLLDDDGRIYLYSGFYQKMNPLLTGGVSLESDGCYVLELESDMLTLKDQKLMLPKEGPLAFQNHEFFEASSIRKYDGLYYFVYSSRHNHELCYAVSHYPDHGFEYKGTLVSNGDLNLDCKPLATSFRENPTSEASHWSNRDERHARNYIGNNHGGMLRLGDDYYIFYHRQTNRHSYSRQTCAEKLVRNENGDFLQVEMTSCGLSQAPLKTEGTYCAGIACNLWSADGTGRVDVPFSQHRYRKHPYITQTGSDVDERMIPDDSFVQKMSSFEGAPRQYIANMRDGAVAGFKYFAFEASVTLEIAARSHGHGLLEISTDPAFGELVGLVPIGTGEAAISKPLRVLPGVQPLYFRYHGTGHVDFDSFTFHAAE